MEKDLNTLLSVLLNTFELMQNSFKDKAESVLQNYTITELHCIEHIGKIEDSNVTKISQDLNITRGGISKLIKKLISKNAIIPYQTPNNKKEIYYKLTEHGKEVFQAHENIHQKWHKKDLKFLSRYNEKEVVFAVNFIRDYTQHLKKTLTDFDWSK